MKYCNLFIYGSSQKFNADLKRNPFRSNFPVIEASMPFHFIGTNTTATCTYQITIMVKVWSLFVLLPRVSFLLKQAWDHVSHFSLCNHYLHLIFLPQKFLFKLYYGRHIDDSCLFARLKISRLSDDCIFCTVYRLMLLLRRKRPSRKTLLWQERSPKERNTSLLPISMPLLTTLLL